MSLSIGRRQYFRNPDEDFVLHGQPPFTRDRPLYQSNSRLTSTSSRLCQHSAVDVDTYRDKKYARSLGDMANSLDMVSRNVGRTLDRGVRFTEPMNSTMIRQHLSDQEINRLYDEEFPEQATYRSPSRTKQIMEEEVQYPVTTHSMDMQHYFPVTLSSSLEFEKMTGDFSRKQAASVGLKRTKSLQRTKSALNKLKNEARNTKYEKLQEKDFEMIHRNDVDKMYLMSSEAPVTSRASVYLTSPFQSEISKLRQERLRIEEERLMELRRLEELENLRPPRQKWYESTGPDFHYECHKNTELQKSTQKWEDTLRNWEDTKALVYSKPSHDIMCA